MAEKFTVELTARECATIFAVMDIEAKESARMAAHLRRQVAAHPVNELPIIVAKLVHSYADEAAVMITIREKARDACPGLKDAETEA